MVSKAALMSSDSLLEEMAGLDRTIRKQNPLCVAELFQLSNDTYMQTEQS